MLQKTSFVISECDPNVILEQINCVQMFVLIFQDYVC